MVAYAGAALSLTLFAVMLALDTSWSTRLWVGLPVGITLVSGLQVVRNTCVAHAAAGVFEHDDFRTTKVDEETAAASRRVAATIWRDAVLGAVAASLIGAATGWL